MGVLTGHYGICQNFRRGIAETRVRYSESRRQKYLKLKSFWSTWRIVRVYAEQSPSLESRCDGFSV